MAKKNKIKGFIVDCRHESSSDSRPKFFETYDEAVDEVHEHFLSYDFEVRNGRAYDPGHEDDRPGHEEDAYECFDGVIIHNGKVAAYTHCGGDGPVAEIHKQD